MGVGYRHRHSLKVVSRYTNRVYQNHERIERRETIHAKGIFSMQDSIKMVEESCPAHCRGIEAVKLCDNRIMNARRDILHPMCGSLLDPS